MTDSSVRLKGRVALVTGAGNGIGQACAVALASHGASVVVNDLGTDEFASGRSSTAADGTVDTIRAAGGTAVANYDSVADAAGCAAAVQTAVDKFGQLDIVVGCAGAIIDGTLAADDDTYLRFMSLFLHQKFWLARAPRSRRWPNAAGVASSPRRRTVPRDCSGSRSSRLRWAA